jgi:hypothetical protein
MTINFKSVDDRHLVIYADGSRVRRFVAVALRRDEDTRSITDSGMVISAL